MNLTKIYNNSVKCEYAVYYCVNICMYLTELNPRKSKINIKHLVFYVGEFFEEMQIKLSK